MNFKELGENIGLDEDEYIEMLNIFIESGGADIEKLDTAIKEGDAEKAHSASHSFKGSSGNMGLEILYEMAKAIDDKVRQGSLGGLAEMLSGLRREYVALISEFKEYTAG